MVDSVLSKLLAADADLEAQEARLVAQLDAIQAKRGSLKTVLEIFDPDQPTAADQNIEVAPSQTTDTVDDLPKEEPAKASSRQAAKATKDKPAPPRKTSNSPKSLRRGWQRYMRDEYIQTPLPDVVAGILQSQPQKVFEIKEIVNTIVVTEIPSTARKGARNRISNLLAEGARKHQWHRPKAGCYRFSK